MERKLDNDPQFTFTLQEICEMTGLDKQSVLDAIDKKVVDFAPVEGRPYTYKFDLKKVEETMVLSEVQEVLGVCELTVLNLIESGQIRGHLQRDGQWLVMVKDLYQFL